MQYSCKSSHVIQLMDENNVLCSLVLATPGVWFTKNSEKNHVAIDNDDLNFPDLEQKGVVLLKKSSCFKEIAQVSFLESIYNVLTIAQVSSRACWKMCPERFK